MVVLRIICHTAHFSLAGIFFSIGFPKKFEGKKNGIFDYRYTGSIPGRNREPSKTGIFQFSSMPVYFSPPSFRSFLVVRQIVSRPFFFSPTAFGLYLVFEKKKSRAKDHWYRVCNRLACRTTILHTRASTDTHPRADCRPHATPCAAH